MITLRRAGTLPRGRIWNPLRNLVLTVRAMTTEFGRLLKFETLTLFPSTASCSTSLS